MTQSASKLAINVHKEPYAWPGGYPKFAITSDGAAICRKCCWAERKSIRESDGHDGFEVAAVDVNWENPDLYCDCCNDKIESAYAD
jgi:hypothetical protein